MNTFFVIIVIIGGIILYIRYRVKEIREQSKVKQNNMLNEEIDKLNEELEYQKLLDKYVELVKPHLPVLHRKHKQLVIQDDYGNYKVDRYLNEIYYFLQATFNITNITMISDLEPRILELVEEYSAEQVQIVDNKLYFNKYMTPTEYEHFCNNLLRQNNWDSNVTKQSGDQGVDIIAEYNNTRVAIQCKLYSSAVGNKAVQEVYAAQKHIEAHYAVVVTNNTYTRAAKELANTTNVRLLHHDDLNNLKEVMGL